MDKETRDYLDALLDTKLKALEAKINARFSSLESKCDVIGTKVDSVAEMLLSPTENRSLGGSSRGYGATIPMAAKPHKG
jgi:hypothetical protein